MIRAIAILHYNAHKVWNGSTVLAESIKEACRLCDIELEVKYMDKFGSKFTNYLKGEKNVVTWGVRVPRYNYFAYGAKHVLFLEMSLLKQASGVYIDASGYCTDSNICTDREWNVAATEDEAMAMEEYITEYYGVDNCQYNSDGPILIALQNERDVPVRYYFDPHSHEPHMIKVVLDIFAKFLPQRKVLVRPHPKYLDEWVKREKLYLSAFRSDWELSIGSTMIDVLRECSALVTVNSTSVTEGLLFNMPVGVIGKGVFTGSEVVYDCSDDFAVLGTVLSHTKPCTSVVNYLCALKRHHLMWRASVDDVLFNQEFKKWVKDVKNG